jgi:hypothetical protein
MTSGDEHRDVEVAMKLVNSVMRLTAPSLGTGVRWLKDELRVRGITVPLTESSLREFVSHAESMVREEQSNEPYTARLRERIVNHAEFLQAWTSSDDRIDLTVPGNDALVSLARKYALPRPWRLSEPSAIEARRPTPTYLRWASGV